MMTLQKLARLVTGNHGLIKTWHQKTKSKMEGLKPKPTIKKELKLYCIISNFPTLIFHFFSTLIWSFFNSEKACFFLLQSTK